MINSYTSWQPLEEVIVGRAYTPDYFDFINNAQVRCQLQQILAETEEDLDNLQKTIEQYGARVLRPNLSAKDQFVKLQTQGGGAPLPPLTPRDWQISLGQKLLRVLNMAEITSHNFHNLLPLRGAQVRDARAWASYLVGARQRYAAHSDVLIAQHHWPVWGSQSMGEYLLRQHDLYKFVHDQTLRLMNHGHTGGDIAEAIRLPEALQQDWSTHSFYGHLKHNVKAVYQRYLGAYEGHPAFLDPLPREAQARKTIEYMGGVDVVLSKARADLAAGEYRWVADVCARIVWVDPSCADKHTTVL